MLTNWLQRADGYPEGAEVPVKDLLGVAVRVRRIGVFVDPLALLALSQEEQEALALADAAMALEAVDNAWADQARKAYADGLKAARNGG